MFWMKSWKMLVAVAIVVVSFGISAYGGPVPQRINYQGTLNNKIGGPANGSFNMTFRIYSTATGTTPLWTEAWSTTNASPVVVTEGVFNVLLGSITPFSNEFFATYPKTYLGVAVANDSEMLPRQMIASVGYAFAAGNGVPKGGIIMWSGTTVPEGWALCNGSNGTPDLSNRFIVGVGSGYAIGDVGGNSTLNLSHSHIVNSHTHTYSGTTNGSDYNVNRTKDNDLYNTAGDTHKHSYSGTTSGVSGLGMDLRLNSEQDIRPPYYALAFIMKL